MIADIFEFNIELDEPPPAGKYLFRLDDAGNHDFSTGTPGIWFRLGVAEGEHEGRAVTVFYPREGRGGNLAVPLLRACGIEIGDGKIDIEKDDLVGHLIEGELSFRDFDGVERPHLRSVRAASAAGEAPTPQRENKPRPPNRKRSTASPKKAE